MSRTEAMWREKLLPVHGGQWQNALLAIETKINNAVSRYPGLDRDALEDMLYQQYGTPCEYCLMLGRLHPNIIRAYPVWDTKKGVRKKERHNQLLEERAVWREEHPGERIPAKYILPTEVGCAVHSKEERICCQIEHRDPAGGNDISNISIACRECNNNKGNFTFQEWIDLCNTIRVAPVTVRKRLILALYRKPGWKNWKGK